MTPTTNELLVGNFVALAVPPPPESMGEFLSGRVSVVGLISLLAAQEAENGVAVRVWENGAIADLLAKTGETVPRAADPSDLSIAALDAHNADLRRLLIAAHEAAERQGNLALDREILSLYQAMADRRMLVLPPLPGG
jgi:hypothetical protein